MPAFFVECHHDCLLDVGGCAGCRAERDLRDGRPPSEVAADLYPLAALHPEAVLAFIESKPSLCGFFAALRRQA